MRETLEALADGQLTVAEAEAALAGYATTGAGRFDATRESRSGVPEAIIASGKTDAEIGDLATTALETTDRAIVTRLGPDGADRLRSRLTAAAEDVTTEYHSRSQVFTAHDPEFDRAHLEATIVVVAAGTSDAAVAGEAAVIAAEMGVTVERIDDVGVASLSRVVDRLPAIRGADVVIVAAGREGALPTVVAGLVDVPVIGLPVSTGYGFGGEGEAALGGMLQSCTELAVVNIDAGYVAGAHAGLIARLVDRVRSDTASE